MHTRLLDQTEPSALVDIFAIFDTKFALCNQHITRIAQHYVSGNSPRIPPLARV